MVLKPKVLHISDLSWFSCPEIAATLNVDTLKSSLFDDLDFLALKETLSSSAGPPHSGRGRRHLAASARKSGHSS